MTPDTYTLRLTEADLPGIRDALDHERYTVLGDANAHGMARDRGWYVALLDGLTRLRELSDRIGWEQGDPFEQEVVLDVDYARTLAEWMEQSGRERLGDAETEEKKDACLSQFNLGRRMLAELDGELAGVAA